ncbi:MAG TPA: DUF2723 domain-containing protein [candidate division Zixibacteria bacterium]
MPSKLYLSLCGGLIFLFSGIVYLLTLSPTLSFIDSGELAAVCATLGIAHPPGYPLYAQLGRISSFLPFGEPIYRFNLMSAFWVSLTNLCLFLSLILISYIFFSKELKTVLKLSAALLITILFSFSRILWSQALINEVYSLNIFLCSLIILIALYWYKTNLNPSKSDTAISPLVYLLTYLIGLSSGNHFLSLLLLPALLYLLISSTKLSSYSSKSLFLIVGVLIIGVSIYLYLPIRAAQNPALNWGNPSNWLNLKNHVSARMFQGRMFSETELVFWDNLKHLSSVFFKQFPVWAFPLMLLGILKAFKKNSKIAIFFLLVILFNLLWSLNYGVKDIDPYFLQTILISSFLLYLGFLFFFQIIEKVLSELKSSGKLKFVSSYMIIFILGIFFLSRFPQEFRAQNRSKNYVPYDFALNILRSSHKDALILTEVWDYYSAWLYLRFVENKRPDLEIIQTELLQWSWYKDYIRKYYPATYKRSFEQIEIYNQFALSMEKGQPVNSLDASMALSKMIDSFIFKNLKDRPVYTTLLDDYKRYAGLPTITEGLLMRFREEKKFYPYEFPEFRLGGILDPAILKTNKEIVCISFYAVSYYNRGLYLKFFDQNEEANRYFQKAYYFKEVFLKHNPGFDFEYF